MNMSYELDILLATLLYILAPILYSLLFFFWK